MLHDVYLQSTIACFQKCWDLKKRKWPREKTLSKKYAKRELSKMQVMRGNEVMR